MTADLVSMMILYPGKETSGRNDAYPRKDYERTKKQYAYYELVEYYYSLVCIVRSRTEKPGAMKLRESGEGRTGHFSMHRNS